MTAAHPEPGLRVGGRYELTSRIAGGGMGEVWRARDGVLGREVAVKLLRREYADDETFLERFRAEARHAASLSHPGIASVYDYGEDGGTAFLVMELVEGEALSHRIKREGALPTAMAVPLIQQAAAALQAAHAAGVVHRDVKPANLLLTADDQVKITDFGIARARDQVPITRTGEVVGTAQYLSPEQALGRPATPRSDLYALGVVAYEALTGRRPFDADTVVATAVAQVHQAPEPLPDDIPPQVADQVLKAMAKDPADRPVSAAAFGTALGAGLNSAIRQAWVEKPTAGGRRRVAAPVQPTTVMAAARTGTSKAITGATQVVSELPLGRPLLLGVIGVVALAVLIALLASSLGGRGTPAAGATSATRTATPTPTPSTSTPSATPKAITLTASDYVGHSATTVAKQLEALGLKTKTTTVRSSRTKGTVTALTPVSGLHPGDTVTLSVADGVSSQPAQKAKPKPKDKPGKGHGHGKKK
ncbi:MAG: protein kinase domain-containing protein [Angustibacter sp.]